MGGKKSEGCVTRDVGGYYEVIKIGIRKICRTFL
jgi:hypothetical protein